MLLDNKTILVAGASGMTGSAIIERLLACCPRATIRATRHSQSAPAVSDGRVAWVQADLRHPAEARRAATGCDCAVLAAASTGGSLAMAAEPWMAVTDNVVMNATMLHAFHQESVQRLVFVSSATVYQDSPVAFKEEHLDYNRDPHPAHHGVGWTMRYLEKLCDFWQQKTGMEAIIVRAANIFGPRAVFDSQRSNVVPALIRKAVSRLDPFEVWGHPDVVRDVIYAGDFAAAVVELLADGSIPGGTYNVGSGTETTVGQIADWALQAAGHTPRTIRWLGEQAPATAQKRVLDCTKIQTAIGWRPRFSVQEGIEMTTRWWEKNRNQWTR